MSKVVTEDILRTELDNLFTRLFKYSDRRFEAIDARFERQNEKFDGVYGLLDAHSKNVETYYHEMLARDPQIQRHERWIHQLADGAGARLESFD